MSKSNSKVTIQDIAQKANVSIATVSRVLNHSNTVRKATAIRVLTAAHEIGYSLNYNNQTDDTLLETKESFAPASSETSIRPILIFAPTLLNPFYGPVIEGIKSAAANNKQRCFIHPVDISFYNSEHLIELIHASNIGGIISFTLTTESIISAVSSQIPIVQCCEANNSDLISSVSIDDTESVLIAMNHIFSTGKKRVGLINGPLTYKYARDRRAAYLRAMEESNLPISPNWIIQLPDNDVDMAYSSVIQLLSGVNAPNAFFATSDIFAAAAIRAITHAGLRVPEDVIVVGFDDIDLAKLNTPSITSISQPAFRMGYVAFELLMERISTPNNPVKHIKMDTRIIIRESSYSQFSGL